MLIRMRKEERRLSDRRSHYSSYEITKTFSEGWVVELVFSLLLGRHTITKMEMIFIYLTKDHRAPKICHLLIFLSDGNYYYYYDKLYKNNEMAQINGLNTRTYLFIHNRLKA